MARELARQARARLLELASVPDLAALGQKRGNRLEALRGDRAGQHSIRVNDQWRICFVWRSDGPHEVEFADHHRGMVMVVTMKDLEAGLVDLSDVVEPGAERLPPVLPGEILADWMEDAGLTAYGLARALHVPRNRVGAILAGKRAISGDTALRLGRYFGTGASFWMSLQARFDLEAAERGAGAAIEREVTPRAA
jgi:addiction module HigA family antidote